MKISDKTIRTPVVSVVIPTYNRRDDLRRAIQSVQDQSFTDWEIIVIDNNSQDGTETMVTSLQEPRLRFYPIHNNGVIAISRNFGIKKSCGRYIAFLDSDDWWTPDKLASSVKVLEEGADITYHDMFRVRSVNQKIFFRKIRTRQVKKPVFTDLITTGNHIINSSVVLRQSLINAVGLINEQADHIAWEDFDFWLRIAEKTEKFERLKGTLGYYWIGGGNTSGPERTLKVLTAIQDKYSSKIARWQEAPPPWMVFAKGKAEYAMQRTVLARTEFASIAWSFENLGIKLKSLVFRGIIFFRFLKS